MRVQLKRARPISQDNCGEWVVLVEGDARFLLLRWNNRGGTKALHWMVRPIGWKRLPNLEDLYRVRFLTRRSAVEALKQSLGVTP